MENVFKRKKQTGNVEKTQYPTKLGKEEEEIPEIKDLAKEFFKEISGYSQAQKINLAYKYLTNKKPDVSLSNDKILNRVLYYFRFRKYIKDTKSFLNKKKNAFKWPIKWKQTFKLSRKKRNQILVLFLNIKGEIEPPKLYPIYSSNMVIIKDRPYQVDPRSFWRIGKYTCQIIKGIDRRPVSNLDYNEIRKRGDSTDSDEFLIKAAMQAVIGAAKKKQVDKKIIIIIAVIVIAAIVFFMSQ